MKLWDVVIEKMLGRDIWISKNQFVFTVERTPKEAITLIRRLIEFYNDRKKDLHIVFIEFEKAYDKILREVHRGWLEKKVPFDYIDAIGNMHKRAKTRMRMIRRRRGICN